MNLKHVTDNALLKDIKELAAKERELTTKVLHHLREIENRRLFSAAGYGSLFEYTVKELGYSEAAAGRRIQASRLLRELPKIERKIESGNLNLTNLSMAANLFRKENIEDKAKKEEIIGRIENKTKRECELVLLDYQSEPSLPKENIRPITKDKVSIHMNVSKATSEKFQELKGLLGHKDLSNDELMNFVLSMAIEKVKKDKFKLTDRPKLTTPPAEPSSRHIPASVKRLVYFRDKGKCRKCGGKYKLEFDHIRPFALGGTNAADNIRLTCFSCNQRLRHEARLQGASQ